MDVTKYKSIEFSEERTKQFYTINTKSQNLKYSWVNSINVSSSQLTNPV